MRSPHLTALFYSSVALFSFWSAEISAADKPASSDSAAAAVSGRELFLREWLPNDPRSHGGDGLGPVFNDTSCVACHNQGGIGGGGAESKNVQSISATFSPQQDIQSAQPVALPASTIQVAASPIQGEGQNPLVQFFSSVLEPTVQAAKANDPKERAKRLEELKKIHPGLAVTRSVVLHKAGTDADYAKWRNTLLLEQSGFQVLGATDAVAFEAQDEFADVQSIPATSTPFAVPAAPDVTLFGGFSGGITTHGVTTIFDNSGLFSQPQPIPNELMALRNEMFLLSSPFGIAVQKGDFVVQAAQRNTTALFGAGLIDSISDKVLRETAATKHDKFPQVTGRVAKLKDGKIGRFGWKAQKSSLHDFTMTACAVELGLNVPEHAQAGLPHKADYKPAGFDLNAQECSALVKFLKEMPAPRQYVPAVPQIADSLREGEKLFAEVGCATCHAPTLGLVSGIYSDLLLHDLGPELGDSGSYGIFQPGSPGDDVDDPLPPLVQQQVPHQVFGIGFGGMLASAETAVPKFGASQTEWRTPPLWGVRDSAPYLHDGRAKSLEQAIAFHGGEGQQMAINFFRLSKDEQTKVLAFLRSLVAPDAVMAAAK